MDVDVDASLAALGSASPSPLHGFGLVKTVSSLIWSIVVVDVVVLVLPTSIIFVLTIVFVIIFLTVVGDPSGDRSPISDSISPRI